MNVRSLFHVYKIILGVTLIDDICFSTVFASSASVIVTLIGLQLTILSLFKLFTYSFKGMHLPNMVAHF